MRRCECTKYRILGNLNFIQSLFLCIQNAKTFENALKCQSVKILKKTYLLDQQILEHFQPKSPWSYQTAFLIIFYNLKNIIHELLYSLYSWQCVSPSPMNRWLILHRKRLAFSPAYTLQSTFHTLSCLRTNSFYNHLN